MSVRTEDLIRQLSQNLAPVEPLPSISRMIASGFLSALPATLALIATVGLRDDLFSGNTPMLYGTTLLALAFIGTGGILTAISGVVPGREASEWSGVGLAALGIVLLSLGAGAVWLQGDFAIAPGDLRHHFECFPTSFLVSLPVVIWLTRVQRRAAPFHIGRATAAACIGGVATATIAIQLCCPASNPLHQLLGHGAAPLLVGAVLWVASMGAWGLLQRSTRARSC